MPQVVVVLVLLCTVFVDGSTYACTRGNNGTSRALLKKHLLCKYDRNVPPESPVTSRVWITVKDLHVMDDENVLYVYYSVINGWNDSSLKYDSNKFGGLDSLRISYGLWSPLLTVLDTKNPLLHDWYQKQFDFYSRNIFVLWNGMVFTQKTAVVAIHCDFDFYLWPFDRQTCQMKMGSRAYDRKAVVFYLSSYMRKVKVQRTEPNGWIVESIIGVNFTNTDTEGDLKVLKPQVAVEFRMKRSYSTLSLIIAAPSLLCAVLTMTTVWLDKGTIRQNATYLSIVWHSVNLIYVGSRMPNGVSGGILILDLLNLSLLVTALSILTSSLDRICSAVFIAPPNILVVVAERIRTSFVPKLLLIPDAESKAVRQVSSYEWVMLSTVSDRLLFLTYFCTYISILTFSFT